MFALTHVQTAALLHNPAAPTTPTCPLCDAACVPPDAVGFGHSVCARCRNVWQPLYIRRTRSAIWGPQGGNTFERAMQARLKAVASGDLARLASDLLDLARIHLTPWVPGHSQVEAADVSVWSSVRSVRAEVVGRLHEAPCQPVHRAQS